MQDDESSIQSFDQGAFLAMPSDTPLLMIIERFLRDTGMAATRFGREAVKDPRFVLDLRLGREPGTRVRCRVEHFMNIYRRDRREGAAA